MNHAPLINSKTVTALAALAFTCPITQAETAGYISTSTAAGTSEVGPTAVYAGQSSQNSLIAHGQSHTLGMPSILYQYGGVGEW